VAPSAAIPAPVPRTIAIVGAGFSGTALAIHLLRQRSSAPLEIVLIDPRAEIGAGVAYATRDYPYPLNVAAGQMSLDSSRPRDFLDYLCDQGIHAEPGDYLPRQVFGEYVREQLRLARANASADNSFSHVSARALQLRRRAGGGFELWLDNGTAVRADDVVLALGNAAPAVPPPCAALAGQPRFINDPWSIGEVQGRTLESVLLIGSGLTMIDAALRLAAIRPWSRCSRSRRDRCASSCAGCGASCGRITPRAATGAKSSRWRARDWPRPGRASMPRNERASCATYVRSGKSIVTACRKAR
jgi:uncharacterized NAD(P)/FAD-binding protein YdhS